MIKAFKYIVVCSAALLLFACKKEYSCECKATVADRRPPTTVKESKSTQALGQKMTEVQATRACESVKTQIQANFKQQLVDTPGVEVYVNCTVK